MSGEGYESIGIEVVGCEVVEVVDPRFGLLGWVATALNTSKRTCPQGVPATWFGGTRVSAITSREEVCELARSMHCKLLAHGLPTYGAKAGLVADPGGPDLLERAEAFGRGAAELLTEKVVLGKDMGATDAVMEAIYRGAGVPQLHVVQQREGGENCPQRIGELAGYRRHMTGLGVAWATESAVAYPSERLERKVLEDKRIIIQGWGVVGVGSAVRLAELGACVQGVSDLGGARVWSARPSAETLAEQGRSHAIVDLQFEGSRDLDAADELLGEPADVLILAAASSCVDERLAKTIAAPIVVEGANFALTPGARKVLFERGIVVVPDLIASSSSAAFVAYQLAHRNTLDPEDLWERIQENIHAVMRRSWHRASEERVPIRNMYIALEHQ